MTVDFFQCLHSYRFPSLQGLAPSAPSVMHPGIPLQTGSGQFGCNDSFQQALILCPPTIQGRSCSFSFRSFLEVRLSTSKSNILLSLSLQESPPTQLNQQVTLCEWRHLCLWSLKHPPSSPYKLDLESSHR